MQQSGHGITKLAWTEDRSLRRSGQEERAAELALIGGRPARQAPPHQGRDPARDALWEWKPETTNTFLVFGINYL